MAAIAARAPSLTRIGADAGRSLRISDAPSWWSELAHRRAHGRAFAQDGKPFGLYGPAAGRGGVLLGGGAQVRLFPGAELFVDYRAEPNVSNITVQSVAAGLRIRF